MADDRLIKKDDHLEKKLHGTLQAGSLRDLVQRRKRERDSRLLLDVSASMSDPINMGSNTRKIDALGQVVKGLEEAGVQLSQILFGTHGHGGVRERRPDERLSPQGGTPLHLGIAYAKRHGAEHLIVISDGDPDDRKAALREAEQFGGPIDVFYVGPAGGSGDAFLRQLSQATGGEYEPTTLADTKQLESKIKGLLGAGTPQLKSGPIQL